MTTDASDNAIGAALEQNRRPITFISRTLFKTETTYAANEIEMLAIIWALQSLRMYLYGTFQVVNFTDHQPLTYATREKSHNTKLKRWKCFVDEFNHLIVRKSGVTNIVAD